MKVLNKILVVATLTFAVGNVALAQSAPRLKGEVVSKQQQAADEAEWKASEDRKYKMREIEWQKENEKNAAIKKSMEQKLKDEKAGHKRPLSKEEKEMGRRESRVISM